MAEQIQELIDKIKTEGIQSAEERAQKIQHDAQAKNEDGCSNNGGPHGDDQHRTASNVERVTNIIMIFVGHGSRHIFDGAIEQFGAHHNGDTQQ